MTMTLNQAAKAAGKAKGTILKAIKDGTLSAPKDEKGRYEIDPAELHRVFPLTSHEQSEKPKLTTPNDHENRIEIERLRAELKAAQTLTDNMAETVADLRERLDREGEERRQLTAMLTDQRTAGQGGKRGLFSFLRSA
jgi:DNA repair exonuclease SbcCD nuclease subunit